MFLGREDEGEQGSFCGGKFRKPRGGHIHPFILPVIWTINEFMSTMTTKIFNNLRDRYQIPNNIPIRLPGKYEKCYFGKTADIGMYDAMFAVGLRLLLMALHRRLAIFLGLSVSQIAPNGCRIFIGAEIL